VDGAELPLRGSPCGRVLTRRGPHDRFSLTLGYSTAVDPNPLRTGDRAVLFTARVAWLAGTAGEAACPRRHTLELARRPSTRGRAACPFGTRELAVPYTGKRAHGVRGAREGTVSETGDVRCVPPDRVAVLRLAARHPPGAGFRAGAVRCAGCHDPLVIDPPTGHQKEHRGTCPRDAVHRWPTLPWMVETRGTPAEAERRRRGFPPAAALEIAENRAARR
jgi:hypothetical protein